MSVLVTGGAGFIGSHLVDLLLDEGHTVSVLDDFSSGTAANLAHLRGHPRLHVEAGDVRNSRELERLVHRADAIVHLAAAVGVRLVTRNPVSALERNLQSTTVLLNSARHCKIPVFFASSSDVYGQAEIMPLSEDSHLIVGPPGISRWAYASGKLACEFLAMAYMQEHGVPVIIGRLFNTTGPRQTATHGMVLPTFVRQALLGEPLTIHGDGRQTRCFCNVRDTVQAIGRLMQTSSAVGQVFNIGTDHEVTINELARRVKAITPTASPTVRITYRKAYGEGFEDIRRRVPDLRKLDRTIGFRPDSDLDHLIESIVAHERERMMLADVHRTPAFR
jgi:UDP-glucose 4-epimerase